MIIFGIINTEYRTQILKNAENKNFRDTGYMLHDTVHIIQETVYFRDTGYKLQDTVHTIQDTVYFRDTGYSTHHKRYSIYVNISGIPDTCYRIQYTSYKIQYICKYFRDT